MHFPTGLLSEASALTNELLKLGVAPPPFHAFLCTFCRRGTATLQFLCDCYFTPALLCHLLLVEVPWSFEFYVHTSCWLFSEYSICAGKTLAT